MDSKIGAVRGPLSPAGGSWIWVPGTRTPDPASWIQDSRSRAQDLGSRVQGPGSRTQDPGSKTLDPAHRTWMLNFNSLFNCLFKCFFSHQIEGVGSGMDIFRHISPKYMDTITKCLSIYTSSGILIQVLCQNIWIP